MNHSSEASDRHPGSDWQREIQDAERASNDAFLARDLERLEQLFSAL
jgi:hypothetical protein